MPVGSDAKGSGTGAAAGATVVLATLAAGQFLMTLDTSVMNVAIATVAEDVDTDVTGIQTAITLYTLVMATLMITGGKIGALIGPQAGVRDRLRDLRRRLAHDLARAVAAGAADRAGRSSKASAQR